MFFDGGERFPRDVINSPGVLTYKPNSPVKVKGAVKMIDDWCVSYGDDSMTDSSPHNSTLGESPTKIKYSPKNSPKETNSLFSVSSAPGPGTYNIGLNMLDVNKGKTLSFRPKSVENSPEKIVPGPGKYHKDTTLVRPTHNKARMKYINPALTIRAEASSTSATNTIKSTPERIKNATISELKDVYTLMKTLPVSSPTRPSP